MKKEDLKIVFFGTPEFAVESLDRLIADGMNVVGVVTATDKPAGRGHKMLQSAVKQYALAHGLTLLQPEKLRDREFIDTLRSLEADLFIVIAFRMLPDVVWQMPRLGTFNLHASLLPKYRGAAPINWAVINGDTETGVTTFFLKREMDTGDIIAQEKTPINPDDNAGDIHDRLMDIGARLTLKTVNDILEGKVKTVAQDEIARDIAPTPAPKIFRDTCRIDWNRPATQIHNLVRGLSPYPAAWTEITTSDGTILTVKIFSTRPLENRAGTPGTATADGDRLIMSAADKDLEILELQPAGKRRMSAAEFLRGTKI